MPDRLDPTFVRAQIELLRHTHPDIWDEGDEQLLADMLEAETGLNEFLTIVMRQMADASAFAVGLSEIINDMNDRRDRFDARHEALRGLVFRLMTHAGVRKIELPIATLSIRDGVPRVTITDEARLPEQFVRIKREPDKHLIASHLKAGERVEGAELSNSEETLAVRVK
jgi:hypothetical protein